MTLSPDAMNYLAKVRESLARCSTIPSTPIPQRMVDEIAGADPMEVAQATTTPSSSSRRSGEWPGEVWELMESLQRSFGIEERHMKIGKRTGRSLWNSGREQAQ
jgi:hypothetical protein